MTAIAGALLWNRKQITLQSGAQNPDTDTGLCQVSKALVDPPLGIPGTAQPANGTLPASRIMVIPQSPLDAWGGVTHGEPYFNTVTNTVHVKFTFSGKGSTTINALFWDPHTLVGPGQADSYNA